jgi:outer membrane lipoprotein carrier protein
VLFGLLFVAGTIQSQSQSSQSEPTTDVNRFLSEFDSLTATFTQELWTTDNQLLETSTGRFMLMRPNRFFWHYETPFEQLIIADGETLWMYDVELEQVTRTALSEVPPGNPALLLSGTSAVETSFDVQQTFEFDGRVWTRLIPKAAGSEFLAVLLAFDDGGPSALELVDGLEQTTRVEFSGVVLNAELDPEQFHFVPPPGADVIGQNR